MAIQQDLEELKLNYGIRKIKVKVSASGYEDSNFSNELDYLSAPRITVKNGILSVYNLNDTVTAINIYSDDVRIDTIAYDPVTATMPVTVSLSVYPLTDGRHTIYVKANGETISNTALYYAGVSPIYGIKGMYGSSGTALTRTDDAVGLVANAGVDLQVVVNDFDSCYPWSEMVEQTDSSGNIFIRIPKFYTSYTQETDGNFATRISADPVDENYKLNPIFINHTTGAELDYFLFGKYTASGTTSLAKSVSGASPLVNISISSLRTACQNNGAGYQQLDIWALKCVQTLFEIEFATTDSQSIMYGYANNNSVAISSGATNNVIAPSGSPTSNSSGKYAMKYRGIENLWGNVTQWMDGMLATGLKPYVCEDATKYANVYNAQGYKAVGYNMINGGTSTYGKNGYDANNPFVQLPTTPGTSYPDYGGCGNSTNYVAFGGGYWSSAADAGLWYINVNYSASHTGSGIGGRLLYKPL